TDRAAPWGRWIDVPVGRIDQSGDATGVDGNLVSEEAWLPGLVQFAIAQRRYRGLLVPGWHSQSVKRSAICPAFSHGVHDTESLPCMCAFAFMVREVVASLGMLRAMRSEPAEV